jgi:hypothetical protein
MAKNLTVLDTKTWKPYFKAKIVADVFHINYQKLTKKLGGSEDNDTQFIYGYKTYIDDDRIFTSQKGEYFTFKLKYYDLLKRTFFYVIEINGVDKIITEANGRFYLDKLDFI